MSADIGIPWFGIGLMAAHGVCAAFMPGDYRTLALWGLGMMFISVITRLGLPAEILPLILSAGLTVCAFRAFGLGSYFVSLAWLVAALFYLPILLWPDWDFRYAPPHIVIFFACCAALLFIAGGGIIEHVKSGRFASLAPSGLFASKTALEVKGEDGPLHSQASRQD